MYTGTKNYTLDQVKELEKDAKQHVGKKVRLTQIQRTPMSGDKPVGSVCTITGTASYRGFNLEFEDGTICLERGYEGLELI